MFVLSCPALVVSENGSMASVVISSPRGQLGRATTQTYYCFDCDRTLTIIATSDSGLICPVCGHVVLEEFETHSSSPPPPPRSATFIDPQSFFPTSDTDSDTELSDHLLPPPPPLPFFITSPAVSTSRAAIVPDLSRLLIHPRPPPPIGPCPPCSEFPVPSASTIDNLFVSLTEENDTHFDSEVDAFQFQPPLPPPPPEHLLRSPPLSPSSSTDDVSEPFYPASAELEEDTRDQQMRSLIPPPPPPPLATSLDAWDYFFPGFQEAELSSPSHERPSQLQPPPPPPWLLQLPPTEGMLDMKMTKKLVSEWECHQCPICIDNFEVNQKVKLTPCNHLYHSDCLLRWLDLHKSCPVCRCKLPSL